MTREEAISIMNVIVHMLEEKYDTDRVEDAVEMAIKALEQDACEDCISRAEAVRIASGYCHLTNIPDELAKLPSVSTEKTGRWKQVQFRTIPYNRISKAKKCSVCGKRKDKYVTWNYCPNCGARMREEGE